VNTLIKYKVYIHGSETPMETNSLGYENDILGKRFLCVKNREGKDAYVNIDYVDLIIKDGDDNASK